ncbi:uncharacterized protein LOC135839783 isoform X1 [Planococcus citri]|uniref:uncharacterized protein LOC135839783 isoform X1 n=1 Tax=Planococcus citri TaxID=170843 RepID=UPI0031F729CA
MKSILLFFLLTICNLNDVITALSIQNESVNDETTNTTSTPSTTSTLSQDDYLESISIQDILSSDIDASEKIGNKIINTVTKFSSDCNTYKDIDLSIHDLPLAGDSISINLGTENVIFHDFNLTTTGGEPNNSDEKLHSYSTSIRCQSSKMGEVEAKLPKIIKITAALKVIQISGFLKEVVIPGSISLILRNGSIAKQFSIETTKSTNYQNDISSRIIYSDSEIHLNTDARFQVAIYNKLGIFIKEVE